MTSLEFRQFLIEIKKFEPERKNPIIGQNNRDTSLLKRFDKAEASQPSAPGNETERGILE